MEKNFTLAFAIILGLTLSASAEELWDHLSSASEATELRGISARFDESGKGRTLHLEIDKLNLALGETSSDPRRGIGWITIAPPAKGWNLSSAEHVQASVKNTGLKPAETTLWVVSSNGWSAVGDSVSLKPNQTATLSCNLRQTYPDKIPKIDPSQIKEIRLMIQRSDSASLEVTGLVATGVAEEWVHPTGRMNVPDMVVGKPAAGKRVRYQLPADAESANGLYCSLYLPPDWQPGKRYPVIAEFPGNIFYSSKSCWSTGRPEQCEMGYGISSGKGAIWVSLPFIDRDNKEIAESGFGSNKGEDTTDYTLAIIEDICSKWGGDRGNLYLCGFSRGSIACGYIGLRNERIAKLWKGIVGCQHYDGSKWRESTMEEAVLRAPRFQGQAIFQVDNKQEKYQPVVDASDPSVKWTWVQSKLGYHATAMFLDDRPATTQLRSWFLDLTSGSLPK